MTTPAGKRSGLYVRISDDHEGRELGVERQEEDLRAAADQAGDVVVDKYVDNDISASTRSTKPRPDYDRLLTDAREGRIEKIWAYTSSRLTRRPLEHEGQIELAERFGIVYSYIRSPSFDLNTANGRMIARMLAAKDANESEETSERIVRKFQQKREAGEFLGGGRLFGWREDGETPDPVEQAALAAACEDVLAGVTTYTIMSQWNASGLRTSRGGEWSLVTVRQVLMRPRNAGLVVHRGEVVGRYPWADAAPVTEDVWSAVCAVLADSTRTTAPGNKPQHLGSGLYVCWGCERPSLRMGKASGRGGDGHPMYVCRSGCPPLWGRRHVGRQALALDAYVEELVVARLSRPDAADLVHVDDEGPRVDAKALRAERVQVRASLEALDDDLDAHRIDRARWERRNTSLTARLAEIDRALVPPARSPLAGVADAEDPAAAYHGLSLERRRAVLSALMVVTVLPLRRKGGPFDPDGVEVERLR